MTVIHKASKMNHTTDELCELIMRGKMLTEIADEWGLSCTAMLNWIASEDDRSARAREARSMAGHSWDRMAVRELSDLPPEATPAQIARARELASHYRWRASKISPPYVDKTHTTVEATVSKAKPVTDEQAMEEIAQLSQQLGMKYVLAKADDVEDDE
jgi:hypothetical protein